MGQIDMKTFMNDMPDAPKERVGDNENVSDEHVAHDAQNVCGINMTQMTAVKRVSYADAVKGKTNAQQEESRNKRSNHSLV